MSARRRLLPRRPDETHKVVNAPNPPNPSAPIPKRISVVAACEACRTTKVKCNGARPKCISCQRKNRQCVYPTRPLESRNEATRRKHNELEQSTGELQQSFASLQMLLRALQESDQDEAVAIFHRIRQGNNVHSIVQHIQTSGLLVQGHLAPDTQRCYEFPFRSHMPVAMLVENNPYIQSLLYEATSVHHVEEQRQMPMSSDPRRFESPYVAPYAAATVVDARLDTIKPSRWTAVSSNDDFLRSLLKPFFLYEYPFFNCFSQDLFLDDMLSGSTEFCSPLLVNAVLSLACNCSNTVHNRFNFWDPNGIGYKFFAEARRLWDIQFHQEPRVTSIQAALVMGVMLNLYAMDKVGITYLKEAVRLSHDLHLFQLPENTANNMSERQLRGHSFTAWSLYFWISVKCYLLCIPPLITCPPASPLPDPHQYPEWYGELYCVYPLNETIYTLNHPVFFKTKCELACILNRFGLKLFDVSHNHDTQQPPTESLQRILIDLGAWHFFLPAILTPAEIVFPSHLNLHLLYLTAMIKVCKLLLSATNGVGMSQDPVSSVAPTLAHSQICFESLMRIYYLRHGYHMADGYLCHAIFDLACYGLAQRSLLATQSPNTAEIETETETETAAAAASSQQDTKSTLILAAKGLSDQSNNYYLPRALFQIVEKEMSAEDRATLHQCVFPTPDADSDSIQSRSSYISSQYPLSIASLKDYPAGARLDRLIKEFTELASDKAGFSTSNP